MKDSEIIFAVQESPEVATRPAF